MEGTKLLEFNPDTKEYVKKLYNLDKPEKMDQAVEILRDWLKKQNHFTKKEYDRKYLESTLIDTKGSIEQAKEKLEKRCIFRTLLPHFYEINDFNEEFGEFVADQIVGFPLPRLTKEHYRVIMYKFYNTDYFNKTLSIIKYFKLSILINEYLKLHDCCAGYIFLVDISEVNVVDLFSKVKPIELRQWSTYYMEVQGLRLKKLIYVTPSKTIDNMIKLIKPLYTKKMVERIEIYKSMEDLVHIVPRDMWPIEFGGTEISARDVKNDWVKMIQSKEFKDYYNEMTNARVDEKVKKIDRDNNFVELAGSFVSLNFD